MSRTPRLLVSTALGTALVSGLAACGTAPHLSVAAVAHPVAAASSHAPSPAPVAVPSSAPAVAQTVRAATVPTLARAVVVPVGRFALGDSVMLGSRSLLGAAGFRVDASVSRQFSAAPALMRARIAARTLPRNVVVHLGTNGTIRLTDCKAVVTAAGTARRVFLVTDRVPRSWMAANNRVLRACDTAYATSRVILVDWATYSANHRSWFAADGFHPSSTGRVYYTRLIDSGVDRFGLR